MKDFQLLRFPALFPLAGSLFNLLRLGLLQGLFYELAKVEGCRNAFFSRQLFQAVFEHFWEGYASPLFAHVLSLSFLHAANSIRPGLVDNQTIFVGCDLFSLTIYDACRISN